MFTNTLIETFLSTNESAPLSISLSYFKNVLCLHFFSLQNRHNVFVRILGEQRGVSHEVKSVKKVTRYFFALFPRALASLSHLFT